MKIRPLGGAVFSCGQMDGHDQAGIRVSFNFTNVPINRQRSAQTAIFMLSKCRTRKSIYVARNTRQVSTIYVITPTSRNTALIEKLAVAEPIGTHRTMSRNQKVHHRATTVTLYIRDRPAFLQLLRTFLKILAKFIDF
jgi:hypothetical protein